jgi:hypothetical protein
MATTYTYYDPYLLQLVTVEREARALADVNAVRSDLPAAWLERLTRLRAYVIACQESQKTADDLFSVKISQYQKEYDKTLPLAIGAADAALVAAGASEVPMRSLVSIELHRG